MVGIVRRAYPARSSPSVRSKLVADAVLARMASQFGLGQEGGGRSSFFRKPKAIPTTDNGF